MIVWFTKLVWFHYDTLQSKFSELDQYADYTFRNGVSIRVSTGDMANTTPFKPYDMYALYPNGNERSYPELSKQALISKMEELHNLNTEE